MGERARGAQLAAALAEQTAKSLLLETRVRALERAAMTPPPLPLSSADDASRVYSREEETRVSVVASSEGRTAGSLSRGVVDVSDHEPDANFSARSARSAIEVRRVVDVSPSATAGSPRPRRRARS